MVEAALTRAHHTSSLLEDKSWMLRKSSKNLVQLQMHLQLGMLQCLMCKLKITAMVTGKRGEGVVQQQLHTDKTEGVVLQQPHCHRATLSMLPGSM